MRAFFHNATTLVRVVFFSLRRRVSEAAEALFCEDGMSEFYECGPQKQLKAMMKRIDNKMWNKTTSMEV